MPYDPMNQVHPGPQEGIDRIPADTTQARTGNTEREQETWFAGIEEGQRRTEHNAAVRGQTDGWKLVPSNPTLTMMNAGWASLAKQGIEIGQVEIEDVYAAMLAAAPTPPATAQDDAKDERPIFEATFGLPTGVQWGGTRYVVDPEYNGSYLANTFVGQWEAWKLRARLAAVHTPQFTISASDRFELTGAVGLLRGYGCAGAADALQRVLDAEMASFGVQGEEAAGDAQELKRKTDLIAELSKIIHNMTVAQQAAWIEWQHGAGAEAGMRWIANGLAGPGHIPEEDEPYGTEAQAYFDANQADPLPACHCGRPSNILHMGNGYCSQEHYAAAIAAQKHKGDE